MIEKIKSYANYIVGLVGVILGAVLFNRNRKVQSLESELSHEKTNTEIKLNDQAREAARANADDLIDAYHKLRDDK